MTEGGFDDIEMKNRNIEEEGETSFGGDDLEDHNISIIIINIEKPKSKFNRVPDVKKDARSIRTSITSDRKKYSMLP